MHTCIIYDLFVDCTSVRTCTSYAYCTCVYMCIPTNAHVHVCVKDIVAILLWQAIQQFMEFVAQIDVCVVHLSYKLMTESHLSVSTL